MASGRFSRLCRLGGVSAIILAGSAAWLPAAGEREPVRRTPRAGEVERLSRAAQRDLAMAAYFGADGMAVLVDGVAGTHSRLGLRVPAAPMRDAVAAAE